MHRIFVVTSIYASSTKLQAITPRCRVMGMSNSFKLEVLEKVKEVGVQGARKAFGIHENTIKG